MSQPSEPKDVLSHEPVSGYRKALFVAILLATAYLAVVLVSTL
jgi:hypothetical protein